MGCVANKLERLYVTRCPQTQFGVSQDYRGVVSVSLLRDVLEVVNVTGNIRQSRDPPIQNGDCHHVVQIAIRAIRHVRGAHQSIGVPHKVISLDVPSHAQGLRDVQYVCEVHPNVGVAHHHIRLHQLTRVCVGGQETADLHGVETDGSQVDGVGGLGLQWLPRGVDDHRVGVLGGGGSLVADGNRIGSLSHITSPETDSYGVGALGAPTSREADSHRTFTLVCTARADTQSHCPRPLIALTRPDTHRKRLSLLLVLTSPVAHGNRVSSLLCETRLGTYRQRSGVLGIPTSLHTHGYGIQPLEVLPRLRAYRNGVGVLGLKPGIQTDCDCVGVLVLPPRSSSQGDHARQGSCQFRVHGGRGPRTYPDYGPVRVNANVPRDVQVSCVRLVPQSQGVVGIHVHDPHRPVGHKGVLGVCKDDGVGGDVPDVRGLLDISRSLDDQVGNI